MTLKKTYPMKIRIMSRTKLKQKETNDAEGLNNERKRGG